MIQICFKDGTNIEYLSFPSKENISIEYFILTNVLVLNFFLPGNLISNQPDFKQLINWNEVKTVNNFMKTSSRKLDF